MENIELSCSYVSVRTFENKDGVEVQYEEIGAGSLDITCKKSQLKKIMKIVESGDEISRDDLEKMSESVDFEFEGGDGQWIWSWIWSDEDALDEAEKDEIQELLYEYSTDDIETLKEEMEAKGFSLVSDVRSLTLFEREDSEEDDDYDDEDSDD